MIIQDIINLIRQDGFSWLIIVAIVFSMIQIIPIKINPWTIIFNWLGKQFNSGVNARLDTIEKSLTAHIEESTERDLRTIRISILNFGTSCMRSEKHTKEEFDFIVTECDKYEKYCEENNIKNGVATATIKQIRRLYDNNIMNNTFLQEANEDD